MADYEWVRRYKRALLERNPILQMWCIEDARKAMTSRKTRLTEDATERQVIDRTLLILEMICQAHVARDY